MIYRISCLILAGMFCLLFSCKKEKSATQELDGQTASLYADSIFYIQNSASLVKPISSAAGTFSAIPEGLDIDDKTGVIDVNKSETGLRYKVTFTPSSGSGTRSASYVIISGINYEDRIYNLSKGDSIAVPVYNSNAKLALPGSGSGSLFDEGGGCKKAGIFVNATTAKINLAESVRKQAIDTGATEKVKLAYRLSDGSNKALNGLDVKIYFYRTEKEIPQYLTDLLNARKATQLSMTSVAQSTVTFASQAQNAARPRPPCIIVVSR